MRNRKWRILVLLLLLAAMLATASLTAVAGSHTIDWYVMAGGGGSASAGDLTLTGTIGQAAAGTTSNGDFDLCSGFWCQVKALARIFLPIVIR